MEVFPYVLQVIVSLSPTVEAVGGNQQVSCVF
jgi:hypothetical protein